MKMLEKKLLNNTLKQVSSSNEFCLPNTAISTWENAFTFIIENQDKKLNGLRNPQLGAIYSVLAHWTCSSKPVTVVMPTGTGKTETMLSLLILSKCPRLLVVVPTDPLREQISSKFINLGVLKDFRILKQEVIHPVVGIVKKKFDTDVDAKSFILNCNVVVTTARFLSGLKEEILSIFVEEFSHIFIDEAHHAEARTWFDIRERFNEKKVVQFTATPYRNDKKRLGADIIFNYPLKKAQQEGYFKSIELIKVYEYSTVKADKAIADLAVQKLREDRQTYPHILLARVETTSRAEEVYKIYKQYTEFNVVRIYSKLPSREKEAIKRAILNKEAHIIICVDMLGEGFDLPELKIAAFHDIRKSLPVTLQFIGRFTRTKYDQELGDATFIANDEEVEAGLSELYRQDRDWNLILSDISEIKTQEEIDFQTLLKGFTDLEEFVVPLNGLRPAMSTVIYKSAYDNWNPHNFNDGLINKDSYDLVKSSLNDKENILVGITARKVLHKWSKYTEISDLIWNLFVMYWSKEQRLLFIHSSDTGSLYKGIAEELLGDSAQIIDGNQNGQIFRCLSGIKRFKLQNVGLIQHLGKLNRFQMNVGTDIEPALSQAQRKRAKKSNIFGYGYENGIDTTLGCSYKGRIWSQATSDIKSFTKWCDKIGRKILDETIDPNVLLKGTLVPKSVSERPFIYPVCIDWNDDIYKYPETRYKFIIGTIEYDFYKSEIDLIEPSETGNIKFCIKCDNELIAQFELYLFNAGIEHNDFKITQTYPEVAVEIVFGKRQMNIETFFYEYTPTIWFANGDSLEGNCLVELKEDTEPYNKDKIQIWNWDGISLNIESQGIDPIITDSIQYRCIEILSAGNYDIIYDDDNANEIADVITIKKTDDKILIELYHLKWAIDGNVSNNIKNLYEVCGQAQKSIHWRFKDSREFFEHLLRRETKTYKGKSCNRFQRGKREDLIEIKKLAEHKLPLEYKIFLVQPGLNKAKISQNELTLLGVTENYLMEKAQINLCVIANEK